LLRRWFCAGWVWLRLGLGMRRGGRFFFRARAVAHYTASRARRVYFSHPMKVLCAFCETINDVEDRRPPGRTVECNLCGRALALLQPGAEPRGPTTAETPAAPPADVAAGGAAIDEAQVGQEHASASTRAGPVPAASSVEPDTGLAVASLPASFHYEVVPHT